MSLPLIGAADADRERSRYEEMQKQLEKPSLAALQAQIQAWRQVALNYLFYVTRGPTEFRTGNEPSYEEAKRRHDEASARINELIKLADAKAKQDNTQGGKPLLGPNSYIGPGGEVVNPIIDIWFPPYPPPTTGGGFLAPPTDTPGPNPGIKKNPPLKKKPSNKKGKLDKLKKPANKKR